MLRRLFSQNGALNAQSEDGDEPPLRSELFSADQMEQHGRTLAGLHTIELGVIVDRLLARLDDNEDALIVACNLLTAAVKSGKRITPAGEWLLDNFYLIEEQIRLARRHLPKGYSRQLPRLSGGPSNGLPRVYDIALSTISHGDGRVDLESLSRFVASYQTVSELKLGEVWAIPIMLRLALIENLRRVAVRIAAHMSGTALASRWADMLMTTAVNDPKNLILTIAEMARSEPPMNSSFVSELVRRLQGQSTTLALALTWIEQQLSESNTTIEQLVQSETQLQAAYQVSISNSIGSLRFLGATDWPKFVESQSVVEHNLLLDPSSIHGKMDFATRDQYRHVVERLAKKSPLRESEIARKAVELATASATTTSPTDRSAHVGYYLIDDGYSALVSASQSKLSIGDGIAGGARRNALLLYLGAIGVITIVLGASLIRIAHDNALPDWLLYLTGFVVLLGCSQLTISIVNWLATLISNPRALPKMDFSLGVPVEARTLVVIPTMLVTPENVSTLVDDLEVRFLANRDHNIHFALLSDFNDSDTETTDADRALVQQARLKIEELNEKYKNGAGSIFFLFHRPRLWNPKQRVWMGQERKRGKLAALNSLLRGGLTEPFSDIVGDPSILSTVKYVITLDTDTQLPRDAARQFVGAMAHPLNKAYYDEKTKRVTHGYGILQPRVGVTLPSTNASLYATLSGSEPGIDPYTRTVSDVYQDLFREGSFIGKGIYDVDTFEIALKNRFPDNRILSHDLLEGCYVRSGLLSDVELYEDYPSAYSSDVSRRRRWIRGDWQLLDWLFPSVPVHEGINERNPLSLVSRWKLFDNLRRSLVAPALLVLFILGWSVLSPVSFWTGVTLALFFVPSLMLSFVDVFRRPRDVNMGQHLAATISSALNRLAQASFNLICLPYEAFFSFDAIVRTLFRMFITHRNLLAWNPSGELHRKEKQDFFSTCLRMSCAPLMATGIAAYLILFNPEAVLIASPVLIGWFMSPVLAWWISLPRAEQTGQLEIGQNLFLRMIARRTWAFFDMFVSEAENWLPPDNFQELPAVGIAHRTSPTNMGLSLLATLTAHDFGYIHTGDVIERLHNALTSMQSLDRYRGHLYNWYDTLTLKPLQPRYISTVDSGNLAGHLLTLNQGLIGLSSEPIIDRRVFDGFEDTLNVLSETLGSSASPDVTKFADVLRAAQSKAPNTLPSMLTSLTQVSEAASLLADKLDDGKNSETLSWARVLQTQCSDMLLELKFLAPWITLPGLENMDPWLAQIPTLNSLATIYKDAKDGLNQQDGSETIAEFRTSREYLILLSEASRRAEERLIKIEQLILAASDLANMEYEFLFDKSRRLLAIGFNADEPRRDASFYDLLASEARLCNFVAVAQGQLPQESWFALARSLTTVGGEQVLFSWSGSMFEYLMPLLVMPTYPNTLLDQTYKSCVKRQIEYGKTRNIPWGISESGYNTVDLHLNYQYKAFGVPGLGLQRGLAQDLVIAPYATAMALMVAPEEACQNLYRLSALGCVGKYGFYEAVDYTSARVPHGQPFAIVKSYMAHHQGMTFLSLSYLLLNRPMQKRFEADPAFQATILLLQERVPKTTIAHVQASDVSDPRITFTDEKLPVRFFSTPDTSVPEVQLLSNGRYHVMMTNSGGGYSRWKDLSVTRWREDSTCDNWGSFCYIRDVDNGEFWSAAHQPSLKKADTYEAIFSESRVEFRRRDHGFDTHSEVVVSSEDDIELRRITITNRSDERRTIEVTTYAEVVLTDAAHDAMHPAFSNLFLQTEIIEEKQAILCHRRPRSVEESPPYMFHLVAVHGVDKKAISYETDRMKFIGRGNTLVNPEAMRSHEPLSGSQGSVLDPIAAIRCQLTLEPEESATVNIVTGVTEERDACLGLVEKYHDRLLADRVFDLAWTHSQVVLRQLNATESDGQLYAALANSVIFANASLRADASTLIKNRRGQSGLWGYAISGDLPIVLLQIKELENIDLVRQLVQAHAYWRLKGLVVDLVIWNEDRAGYRQLIQEQILGLIAGGTGANLMDRPGGIFVRAAEQISSEDRILLQTVARAIISDSRGSLEDQIKRRMVREVKTPKFVATRVHKPARTLSTELTRDDVVLSNGLGGFTPDGREYVITTSPGHVTPAPWVNVLANPFFGTVISENGLAYTWLENAHEFRLTPWNNDPVTDAAGEAFYIRDEETGYFWSPTPLPARGVTPYRSRHGFGYSVFEHTEDGITTELQIYVALDAPVKIASLKIRNNSGRTRKLSATAYVEWVLGDLRQKTSMHVATEVDAMTGALFARNTYNSEFSERVAFLDVDDTTRTLTGDRTEFLGRNGTMANPAAMRRFRLSGKVGAGLDPCGAINVPFELSDGHEREVVFRMGIGQNVDDAAILVHRFRGGMARREAYETVCQYWKHTLGAVHVQTPDLALNMLVNGWLLYQTLSSRIWGRSGYYQSGGAFGYRDQLQDAMALVHCEPHLLRKQILLCASRQFVEGDVQHWWHPPSGRGVRTHISDDYLWLPLAASRYVLTTGDTGILNETAPYLTGRPVNPQDDSYYDLPGHSTETASLYEHCKQAIMHGLRFGEHGLPLMGGGDWNDGMNLVGIEGKGESVWLAFFLHEVLRRFIKIARLKDDHTFAKLCETEAERLRSNVEQHAWDGAWYRRAYFDNGAMLGSASNTECQIDSISQSWSVLSGAGEPTRASMSMQSVSDRLVRRDEGLIQLLDPPFDKSDLNPGYIKGYVPGVRENGGQYTHSAIWATMAFAALGDVKSAWEAFNMINPIHHGDTRERIAIYKVEPYVVAADVYGVAPHNGRGGWTWYTGSAAWMYRLIVESLLGLRLNTNKLRFVPCLPPEWNEFTVHYRYRETVYHITVNQSDEAEQTQMVIVDGACQLEPCIYLVDDRAEHSATITIPRRPSLP